MGKLKFSEFHFVKSFINQYSLCSRQRLSSMIRLWMVPCGWSPKSLSLLWIFPTFPNQTENYFPIWKKKTQFFPLDRLSIRIAFIWQFNLLFPAKRWQIELPSLFNRFSYPFRSPRNRTLFGHTLPPLTLETNKINLRFFFSFFVITRFVIFDAQLIIGCLHWRKIVEWVFIMSARVIRIFSASAVMVGGVNPVNAADWTRPSRSHSNLQCQLKVCHSIR